LVFITFSTKGFKAIIKLLKTKNSYWYDEISTKLLKIIAAYIYSPVTYIRVCNKSIFSGIFPDRLKFSVIKPMHKKVDRMNPTNNRPISLLTFLKGF